MIRVKSVLAMSLSTILGAAGIAAAADNCTDWSLQPDGSEWRLCTKESNGQRYCQERRGNTISTVSCR